MDSCWLDVIEHRLVVSGIIGVYCVGSDRYCIAMAFVCFNIQ